MKRSRIKLPLEDYKNLCTAVHHRDRWKCRCCKRRNNLHAHHIIFRSQGGDDADWNLITLCHECHESLHNRYIVIHAADGSELVDANKEVRFQFIDGWLPRRLVA